MKTYKISYFLILIFLVQIFFVPADTFSGDRGQKYKHYNDRSINKILGHSHRKSGFHSGNKIRCLFTNFGSIGRYAPGRIEWPAYSGHEYGYEFGPMIVAEIVVDRNGIMDTVHVAEEGILDGGDDDFEPISGFAAPAPNTNPALWSDPTTWGAAWDLWPGQFGLGTITADEESYFIMNDQDEDGTGHGNTTSRHDYYPDDPNIQGLNIEVESRGYQWAASVAEDIIFFIYKVTNKGTKPLEKVAAGYFCDLDVGGYPDYADDGADFDSLTNLVYSWDTDNASVNFPSGEDIGWVGFKFLETPAVDNDGIDNDGDGMIDESQYNGIDDDGDWDATDEDAAADPNDLDGLSDDVGAGGIPGSGDEGENDGVPTVGEPDYETEDLDEADQLGLTSMRAYDYNSDYFAGNDSTMWIAMEPGNFSHDFPVGDNIFVFGAGYFRLDPGESQNFSIAIVVGADSADMKYNAEIAQKIYELGYQFTKAPLPPALSAVPGDGKITLYWDHKAEKSVDPVMGEDFEGYTIYRSTDKGATWGDPVTDNVGRQVLWKPIAQFDLKDGIKGPHALDTAGKTGGTGEGSGVHFNMGNDTGLSHSFVDHDVTNGVKYYYAVCSYDRGDAEAGIAPSECGKAIKNPDNITETNIVSVVPNVHAAGYSVSQIEEFETGNSRSHATVTVDVIDPTKVLSTEYELTFEVTSDTTKTYTVTDKTNNTVTIDASSYLTGEEVFFDGLRLTVDDVDVITPDETLTRWTIGECNYESEVILYGSDTPSPGDDGIDLPADYEIRFYDEIVDTSDVLNEQEVKFEVWDITNNIRVPFIFMDLDKSKNPDSYITPGDKILPIMYVNNRPKGTWKMTFKAPSDTSVEIIAPTAGDIFHLEIEEPLTENDTYTIKTVETKFLAATESDLDLVKVVPNPYVSANKWEQGLPGLTTGRGERRIDFINLPPECTIRIYTTYGELVNTLNHDHRGTSDMLDGTESWNLLSRDDREIAFGVYLFHVETAEGISKIGKFALIK
ncbi:hypothetical protein H8E88_09360 [candidate division KSB1 bacterium]|nr:hypothetical protein [candidate division KSB1 bacterium]MBL7095269.1 hypothetical protein [candidate division KSB1 bacterium]